MLLNTAVLTNILNELYVGVAARAQQERFMRKAVIGKFLNEAQAQQRGYQRMWAFLAQFFVSLFDHNSVLL